jgi:hypothetical protein
VAKDKFAVKTKDEVKDQTKDRTAIIIDEKAP